MGLENNHIAKQIKERVKAIDPKAQITIFGSRARGESHSDSDWDILILTDNPATVKVEDAFRDSLFDLEIETGEVLSIFVYQKSDWNSRHKVTPFYRNIKKEGIKL